MIVIGFSADEYGSAALEHGIAEAKVRGTALRVINSTKGDSWSDPKFASARWVTSAYAVARSAADEHARIPMPPPPALDFSMTG